MIQNLLKHASTWSSLCLMLVLFLGGLVPAYTFHMNYKGDSYDYLLTLFALSFLGFFWKFLFQKINTNNFLFILSFLACVSFILRYHFAFSYEQILYSDFKTMWLHAQKVVSKGWIKPWSLQVERPLASLIPLVALFGKSTSVFKIFNITALTLQNMMCASLSKKWFSPLAGILCFLVLSFIPESYYASLIPSHDISGSFYLVLYLWLFNLSLEYLTDKKNILFCSIFFILTFVGLLLEIQRNIFIVAFLSCFSYSLLIYFNTAKSHFYKWLIIAQIVQYISFIFLSTLLSSSGILFKREGGSSFGRGFNHGHTFSNGHFSHGRYFWSKYAKPLGSNPRGKSFVISNHMDLAYYSNAIRGSDLYYNYKERPENYLLRLKRLTKIGQVLFYYSRLKDHTKDKQKKLNIFFKDINNYFNRIYSFLLLLGLSLFFLCLFFKARINQGIYLTILCFGIFIVAIGVTGENQPRYLFVCWPLWTITIIGILDYFFSFTTGEKIKKKPSDIILKVSRAGLLSFLVLTVIAITSFFVLFSKSDYKLIDMRTFSNLSCSENISYQDCQKKRLKFKKKTLEKPYAMLKLDPCLYNEKASYLKISKTLKTKKDKNYEISFFANLQNGDNLKKGAINFLVYINNKQMEKIDLAHLKKNRYFKIPLPKYSGSLAELSFVLMSTKDNSLSHKNTRKAHLNIEFLSIRENSN